MSRHLWADTSLFEKSSIKSEEKFALYKLHDSDYVPNASPAENNVRRPKERQQFELLSLRDPDEYQDSTQVITYDMPSCRGNEIDRKIALGATVTFQPLATPKSVLLKGGGLMEVHAGANKFYRGTVVESEGCLEFYDSIRDFHPVQFTLYPTKNNSAVLSSHRQIPSSLQQQFSTVEDQSKPHTRIIFSVESSDYFGYQVMAHGMAFLQSNQTSASWTRLLTAKQPDDLSDHFPTFTAPKSLYSMEYVPINKPDIIDKWLNSHDAPHPDDIVVVIDPDNWLLKDIHDWTKDVSSKQAVGQVAYYGWDERIASIWNAICKKSCDRKIDPVGVPYFVKASDLKEIAPLWRSYSIVIHQKMKTDPAFNSKHEALGIGWAAEMVGFNAACAHLQITTKVVDNLQVRDTSTSHDWDRWSKMPMIHMGRAWFPDEAKVLAAPWAHQDDGGFSSKGIQVWCKCNNTAGNVQPWPLPTNMDFVSYHTLRLLHQSKVHFGPVPVNETYRRENNYYFAPI